MVSRVFRFNYDLAPPKIYCRLPIADCRLPIADCRLPIADCRLPIADCRLPIADCRSKLHIVGIVKDFNFSTMRQQVAPLCMLLNQNNCNMALRLSSNNMHQLVAQIEGKYKSMAPGQPFNYSFMDEDFNNLYRTEQHMGVIAISFSSLAILIACLGLFDLAAYAAEQRTKEIGIRKVLDATVSNITTMLSKDFLKLVIVAAVIAFPLAWWFMHSWLQDFAYRTNISWWVFIMAGIAAAMIALVTVRFRTIKAAISNPIKSLRAE
jgi:putative ABC transport system permease protein